MLCHVIAFCNIVIAFQYQFEIKSINFDVQLIESMNIDSKQYTIAWFITETTWSLKYVYILLDQYSKNNVTVQHYLC